MQDFSFKYNILYFTTSAIFTSVFLLTQPNKTVGQLLTAEYVDFKLTAPNQCPRPYYDGADTIYLLGGCDSPINRIEVFSVSTDTITRKSIGSLPGGGVSGTVQPDNFGNVFYFGGGGSNRDVYKFDPVANQTSVVATLPVDVWGSSSVKYNDSSNTVYILGGGGQNYPSTLLAFDLVLLNYTTIASNLTYYVRGAASVQVGNKAIIFDSWNGLNKTIEFDLNTFQMSLVGPGTLPILTSYLYPSSVRDETHAYLIGGYEPSAGPTNGIYRFDLTTFENTFLPVSNFAVEGNSYYWVSPASIYVQKQNRIYFFGGYSYNQTTDSYKTYDDIFFIDLSPLNPEPTTTTTTPTPTTEQPAISTTMNPDFFTCINRKNGFYPHPTDCSLFIVCEDDELEILTCPPPLLFDPVTTNCAFPEDVECGLSCIDKPNGNYPHPHDCSLYIICRNEVTNVFKCTSPLLFNPATSSCDFPYNVECPWLLSSS